MDLHFTPLRDVASDDYRFVEELLVSSFPVDEYRDLEALRQHVSDTEEFHLLLAADGGEPVGFVSYWDFGACCYVEHLAVHPRLRNRHYGRHIVQHLQQSARALVLEVELPTDELTRRRIGFYQRLGFEVCRLPYVQPAYRVGGATIAMHLMLWGELPAGMDLEAVKARIFRSVYGVSAS